LGLHSVLECDAGIDLRGPVRRVDLAEALGRVTQITENAFGTSRTLYYRYDQAGRLYGVKLNADTLATYFYDPNGNRIAVKSAAGTDSATYDEQDRLTSRGVMASGYTRYTYSAAGELKSKTVGSAVTQYVYDPLGNLVSVTLPNGDVVTYSADGTGRCSDPYFVRQVSARSVCIGRFPNSEPARPPKSELFGVFVISSWVRNWADFSRPRQEDRRPPS
jgi:YD repeat-containing protein